VVSKGELSNPPIKGPITPPSQLKIGKYANAASRLEGSDNSPITVGMISLQLLKTPSKIWPAIAYQLANSLEG